MTDTNVYIDRRYRARMEWFDTYASIADRVIKLSMDGVKSIIAVVSSRMPTHRRWNGISPHPASNFVDPMIVSVLIQTDIALLDHWIVAVSADVVVGNDDNCCSSALHVVL